MKVNLFKFCYFFRVGTVFLRRKSSEILKNPNLKSKLEICVKFKAAKT